MKSRLLVFPLSLRLAGSLLLVGLLSVLLLLPYQPVMADGGGFPTATSFPTVTPTLGPAKGLGETAPLPPTPTVAELLPGAAGAAPADQPTAVSGAAAPVSGQGDNSTAPLPSTQGGTLSIAMIVGLASLATLILIGLVLVIRRRK